MSAVWPQVQSSPAVLAPGHSQDMTITFKPMIAQKYDIAVPVRINGLYTINILLSGEGAPLRVELAKEEQLQRGVMFGAVPMGSSCSRALSLVNRGRAAAFVSFEPSAELLERLGIELVPAGGVQLRPRETADLTLWYRWVEQPGGGCWKLEPLILFCWSSQLYVDCGLAH
eukprot:GHUV01030012.1.p1 GENE.GHUV01030012.1~~GHUV01030012.1.p1  ORF type:complete len:171 (-),score=43.69 GHUV01030012.1:309-821(-)